MIFDLLRLRELVEPRHFAMSVEGNVVVCSMVMHITYGCLILCDEVMGAS